MIRSFGNKRTEALFEDAFVREFQGIARRVKRKLEAVNAASRLEDLAVPTTYRSWTVTEAMPMTADEFAPVTPGEMLMEEFLADYGLSPTDLARAISVPARRVVDIVRNRRRITADIAIRLAVFFDNTPEFWMNLQSHYDLKIARRNLTPEEVERIKAQRAA